MIVVDSSALIAILEREPERDAFAAAIANADRCIVSAVTPLETAMVIRSRRGPAGLDALNQLIDDSAIEVIAFDDAHVERAIAAFALYGKGIHPTARLNMGDCATYALAKSANAPLLFKGGDFAATDLVPPIS